MILVKSEQLGSTQLTSSFDHEMSSTNASEKDYVAEVTKKSKKASIPRVIGSPGNGFKKDCPRRSLKKEKLTKNTCRNYTQWIRRTCFRILSRYYTSEFKKY